MEGPLIVFCVEGPAGSGKTSLIDKLIYQDIWNQPPPMMKIDRPRSYDGNRGIMLSQTKDYLSCLAVANCIPGVWVLDRYMMSQWVYGAIRNRAKLNPDVGFGLLSAGIMNINNAYLESEMRRGRIYTKDTPTIFVMYLFVLPSLLRLQTQRAQTTRDYPYDAMIELSYFREAAETLQKAYPTLIYQPLSLEDQKADAALVDGIKDAIQTARSTYDLSRSRPTQSR